MLDSKIKDKIEDKIIDKIYIHCPGDMDVGIPADNCEIVFPEGFSLIDREDMENIRKLFKNTFYDIYQMDNIEVLFDFEKKDKLTKQMNYDLSLKYEIKRILKQDFPDAIISNLDIQDKLETGEKRLVCEINSKTFYHSSLPAFSRKKIWKLLNGK